MRSKYTIHEVIRLQQKYEHSRMQLSNYSYFIKVILFLSATNDGHN